MLVKCFHSSPTCHSGSKSLMSGTPVRRCWEQKTGSTQEKTCPSATSFITNLPRTSPLLNPTSVARRQRIKDWTILCHYICNFFYLIYKIQFLHHTEQSASFWNMHLIIPFTDTIFILYKKCRNCTRKTWQNTDL